VAFVKELPGAITQGETLEEARVKLKDAVRLLIETNARMAEGRIAGRRAIHEPLRIGEAA